MRVSLTAIAQYADAHAAVADVSWSSSNPSVADVDSSGNLTAVGIGTATVSASAGRVTGIAPITVSTIPGGNWLDVSGTWSGADSLELSCTWLGGPGPSPCEGQYNGGARDPTTLVVQQVADAAACRASIGVMGAFSGTLVGSVGVDGHVRLAGTVAGQEVGVARIDDADFSLDSSGSLVGTYSWTRTFVNGFGVQKVVQTWRLEALARQQ